MDELAKLRWRLRMTRLIPWLSEAAMGKILLAAIDLYVRSDADTREVIRQMVRRHGYFAWAAKLPFKPDNSEQTFAHLVHFSILDQDTDPRDARIGLQILQSKANVSPEELDRLCNRAADLSSEIDRFQWFGSTAQVLRELRPFRTPRGQRKRRNRDRSPSA
jgi:hypothetical protein